MPDSSANASLMTLLDASLQQAAWYQGGYFNHLPMALHALAELGASEQRLQVWFDHYASRLQPVAAIEPAPDFDPMAHLGEADTLPACRAFFLKAVEEGDALAVARTYWPRLARGPAAAAFHGLIQLAHALQVGHPGQVAHGLAALTASNCDLGTPGLSAQADSVVQRLVALRQWRLLLASQPLSDWIIGRIQWAVNLPGFAAAACMPEGLTLADLTAACAQLYWQHRNLTALHMVTACHAYRQITNHLGDGDLGALWLALAAAFVAVDEDFDPVPPQLPATLPDWAQLRAKACESDNEHVIKLTHCCWREFEHYGWPLHQAIAARVNGLLVAA
ncbi:questin oxidase family protein [Parachitinimonas caeni]|uniref:Questin oxidase family protein n=1 Tax=Parachitinimonas caeni TaxID=3031301 RepID=A0ABT7DTC1_9NEIS|nr:questin oxidase family protein [Parachitinimonas caeni]MDK2123281.1 questin oxidase family protein [Parachitinimonas caeni]